MFHLFTIMNQNHQAPLLTTCSLLFQVLPLSYSKVMEIKEIDWHNSLQFCYPVEDCKNMDLRLGTISVLWLYLQTVTSKRPTCSSTNIFSQPFPAQKVSLTQFPAFQFCMENGLWSDRSLCCACKLGRSQ